MEKNGVDLEESAAFWRKSAARAAALSPNKYEKRTPLPARIVWTGALGGFENFRNKVEGHYAQIGAGYLFDEEIQAKFLEKGYEAILEFQEEGIPVTQFKKDVGLSILTVLVLRSAVSASLVLLQNEPSLNRMILIKRKK